MGGVRVPERARDVADLPPGIAQHLARGLEARLGDHLGVGQALSVQAALEGASAGTHEAGDSPHVDWAAGEEQADDVPHALVEVVSGAVARWLCTSHRWRVRGLRDGAHFPRGVLPFGAAVDAERA